MKSSWRHWKLVAIVCLVGIAIAFAAMPVSATINESRISRLESDIYRLQTEVSQLSSQLRRLDRANPNPVEVPAIDRSQTATTASDPMFDRLATLVIELKRRIDGFEERLVELEQSR